MSGVRQRARKFLSSRGEIGWSEDKVVAFAESESSLSRKQERDAIAKIICSECAADFYWSPARLIGEKWLHSCLSLPGHSDCKAAAIHERGRKVEG